ncbi:AraC family transcriptional regulator [Paenibacillus sp. FSL A5-0031]|uniref:AraC family transcriptional regulator n=1 Tax=Paenibacillus sp. FSL A5-0031 TaxID=1920420 RepID=UPI00096BFFBF|nr:helix-turn-helix domain-containing protein [Paenibacillus sp. FSL A5-0031]OME74013.1 AraC family transcriptional regulator [Paenibacillus sp. FSL A5-0031]
MPAVQLKNNGKLYSKLLFTITLCIVLTLMVSSLFNFFTYMQIDLKKAYQSDVSNLTQTSKEVISMTESAQSLSFQIYRTFSVSKLMFYNDPNIYDVTAAMNELNNYLNSMPFIESIYVYNSANGLFYTASRQAEGGTFNKEELADKGILDILDNYQEYRPFTPIPRTYKTVNLTGEQLTKAYTYLGYDAIGRTQTINSAVIINISSAWINKDIGVNKSDSEGKSYILDNQNLLLSGDTLLPKKLSNEDNRIINEKIKNKESGYVVADFDGKKSLISYTSPDSLDWQYVRVTPYKHVTKAIYSIRNTTIMIAVIILAIGLFISWLLSRMLYRPIHQIMNKMNILETEKRNSSYTIRQNMLRSLIQGSQSLQTNAQLQKLMVSGITFDFHARYRVVLLKIDELAALKQNRGDDLHVYKFAIMNIASEIAHNDYRVETVDMDADYVIMLLGRPDESDELDDEMLRDMLAKIQRSSLDFLKIGLSITYSPEAFQAQQLSTHYKLVKEASQHRLFYGLGSLINGQDIIALKSKEYIFPADKERKLTDALMTSKTEEAKKLFAEIVQETAQYPIHVVQLAISHLTMTVNNILFTIQKNNSLDVEASLSIHIPTPDHFETINELNEVFFSLFDDIQMKLSMKRSTKQGDLIRKINDLIQKEYANPNLSLNWIADELDMSSIYLSRVYKQQTLATIVDVINNVRMERAKEHLENTDLSIVDIAVKSGYTSSSYFHRMFKKSFGVTPSDYRKTKLG